MGSFRRSRKKTTLDGGGPFISSWTSTYAGQSFHKLIESPTSGMDLLSLPYRLATGELGGGGEPESRDLRHRCHGRGEAERIDLEHLVCLRKLATKHQRHRIHSWTTPPSGARAGFRACSGVSEYYCDRLYSRKSAYQISIVHADFQFPSRRSWVSSPTFHHPCLSEEEDKAAGSNQLPCGHGLAARRRKSAKRRPRRPSWRSEGSLTCCRSGKSISSNKSQSKRILRRRTFKQIRMVRIVAKRFDSGSFLKADRGWKMQWPKPPSDERNSTRRTWNRHKRK